MSSHGRFNFRFDDSDVIYIPSIPDSQPSVHDQTLYEEILNERRLEMASPTVQFSDNVLRINLFSNSPAEKLKFLNTTVQDVRQSRGYDAVRKIVVYVSNRIGSFAAFFEKRSFSRDLVEERTSGTMLAYAKEFWSPLRTCTCGHIPSEI